MRRSDYVLDKKMLTPSLRLCYEKALGHALGEFLAEISLVDPLVMQTFVMSRKQANINDLLASSAELSLKPGLLRCAELDEFEPDEVDFDEDAADALALELRLQHAELLAWFRVLFLQNSIGVDLHRVRFRERLGSESENLARFARVMADLRIVRQ
jgi:hypothetical protein